MGHQSGETQPQRNVSHAGQKYLNCNTVRASSAQSKKVTPPPRQKQRHGAENDSNLVKFIPKHALHLLIVQPHDKAAPSHKDGLVFKCEGRCFSRGEFTSRLEHRRLTDEKTHCNSCESNTTGACRKAKRHWHARAHTQCRTHNVSHTKQLANDSCALG